MEEYVKQALEIVKAQASVRNMTEEEIGSMVRSLTLEIKNLAEGTVPETLVRTSVMFDEAKKAIREKSITCMECEKSFKVLTKRHLATHGLTPDEYREKWGYKKGTSLVAKALARERRKKMQEMRLWEKRIKK
ncbi:MAG: MucR family transcriptional regulator [Desulfomicrobium sp.]|jgi:predicted transcriptional regulator|nr:MucR family transcriptional regulator [Desulfomicrobium sp.]NLV97011.1 MucR family transcriptional regulator [Desulfovibrionales bacterium]